MAPPGRVSCICAPCSRCDCPGPAGHRDSDVPEAEAPAAGVPGSSAGGWSDRRERIDVPWALPQGTTGETQDQRRSAATGILPVPLYPPFIRRPLGSFDMMSVSTLVYWPEGKVGTRRHPVRADALVFVSVVRLRLCAGDNGTSPSPVPYE